jgi:rRNA maturation protein Rpf1
MLITSSRRRSLTTIHFCKELESVLPFSLYIPRGKKPLRTLIDHAYMVGMERLCVVETQEEKPTKMSFIRVGLEWRWIGHIDVTVSLGKEKLPSIEEDIVLGIEGGGTYRENISYFFNASSEASYASIHLKNDTITFYRKDRYTTPVGPTIKVLELHRYDGNG